MTNATRHVGNDGDPAAPAVATSGNSPVNAANASIIAAIAADDAHIAADGTRARLAEAMGRALGLASEAAEHGDVPVGAIIIDGGGRIVGRGRNHREERADPLSHAEVEAMRDAARTLGGWNLADCTLVVTLEPCPMCAGAAVSAHVGRIAFGAWDPKMGACGSVWDIPRDPHVGFAPEVHGGVREPECAAMLSAWFAAHRARSRDGEPTHPAPGPAIAD